VFDTWCTYVKPPRWPFASLGPRNVHGISNLALRGAPKVREALIALVGQLQGCVFTAHNVDFDLAFLQHHAELAGVALPSAEPVCTLMLSRSLDPSASRSHRLTDLCEHYGVSLIRAHDALEDSRATASILPHLLSEAAVSTIEELRAVAAPSGRRRQGQRRP
jgi:DNA polymerase-3 subunit epsilon